MTNVDAVYAHMEKQKLSLPSAVRGDLYLTDIVVKPGEKSIQRIYDHLTMDFGKLSAAQAKNFSRSIKSELLQQCIDHKELIYDHDIHFYYHLRDSRGRVMLLENISKNKCSRFALAHPWN